MRNISILAVCISSCLLHAAAQATRSAIDPLLKQPLQSQVLVAEELRAAQQALNEITGEFTSEDLLGKIFSSFCIGK